MPGWLMIMRVAAAEEPAPGYLRLLLMTTSPGKTACVTLRKAAALTLLLEPEPPLFGWPEPKFGLPNVPELAGGGWLPESLSPTANPPMEAATAATAM